MAIPHVLILGGTSEARVLARRLVARGDMRVTLSLAGRTENPLPQAGAVRVGGFGGAQGLAQWLRAGQVDVLVDATHPFAARITANAVEASRAAAVPLVRLERAPWEPQPGDDWVGARDIDHAAALLGEAPRTVFLAIGRQEAGRFAIRPQHRYIVRSVEPVDTAERIAGAHYILGRGPFAEADEHALLLEHGIEIIVAKNSGGEATYGKIAAARQLGLPVVMVSRPQPPVGDAAATVDEAIVRIGDHVGLPADRGE
ncbi:cobalt-precorrin-6A reductase [Neoaquamicrobium sediminum]|uniref:cobalt-precorrin-6A reductase n=1 Tax=Neoaquamicrobium sediminum TaxID=1849104 RepID=UPI003BABF137